MLLADFFRYCRAILPILSVAVSLYIIVLTSNSFWLNVAGPGHLVLSVFWFISSLLCLISSFYILTKNRKQDKNRYLLWFIISLTFGTIYLYITSSTRRLEYISILHSYVTYEASEGLQNIFIHQYPFPYMQEGFIYSRTLESHDIVLTVLLLWIVLTIILEKFSGTIISFLGEDLLPNSIQ